MNNLTDNNRTTKRAWELGFKGDALYLLESCPECGQLRFGRSLESWEVVHHKNSNRSDNRPSNLELIGRQSTHLAVTHADKEIRLLRFQIKILNERVDHITAVIREHGNPELNSMLDDIDKRVETIYPASFKDDEIVQARPETDGVLEQSVWSYSPSPPSSRADPRPNPVPG